MHPPRSVVSSGRLSDASKSLRFVAIILFTSSVGLRGLAGRPADLLPVRGIISRANPTRRSGTLVAAPMLIVCEHNPETQSSVEMVTVNEIPLQTLTQMKVTTN